MPRTPNEPKLSFASRYEPNPPDTGALGDFEPTLTQQNFKEECDINNIMRNYTQTGLLPQGTTQTALYGDFSQVDDYLNAMLILDTARDQFAELPAKVRQHFNNDPAELLAFVHNPDNRAEAQALGLLKDEPTPPTPPAPTPAPNTGNDGKGS